MSSNRSQPVTTVMSSSLHLAGPTARRPGKKTASERHSLPSYTVHTIVNAVHSQTVPEANMARRQQAAVEDAGPPPPGFIPPPGGENRRPPPTPQPGVAQALTRLSTHG